MVFSSQVRWYSNSGLFTGYEFFLFRDNPIFEVPAMELFIIKVRGIVNAANAVAPEEMTTLKLLNQGAICAYHLVATSLRILCQYLFDLI